MLVTFQCVALSLAEGAIVSALGQQPQTNDIANTEPVFAANAKWVNGMAPGYWPTAGAGLTLNLSAGTAQCGSSSVNYAGGTLTLSNGTNYVYLDSNAACAPASNQTGFTEGNSPVAIVTAASGAITAITDARTFYYSGLPVKIANTYAGADINAKINAAITSTSGRNPVLVIPGSYTGIATMMSLNQEGATVLLDGVTITCNSTPAICAQVVAPHTRLVGKGKIAGPGSTGVGLKVGGDYAIAASGGAVRASNVVTITTTTPHGLAAGVIVSILNVTDSSFNGVFTVASAPSATTFTYNQTGTSAASGNGVATVSGHFARVDSLEITGFLTGFLLENSYYGNFYDIDSHGNAGKNFWVTYQTIFDTFVGVSARGAGTSTNGIFIDDGVPAGSGLSNTAQQDIWFFNPDTEGNTTEQVRIQGCRNCGFSGGHFEPAAAVDLPAPNNTLTFTNGSATVSSGATSEFAAVAVGQIIKDKADAASAWMRVCTVNSNTTVTLCDAYQGTGGSNHSGHTSAGSISVASGTAASSGVQINWPDLVAGPGIYVQSGDQARINGAYLAGPVTLGSAPTNTTVMANNFSGGLVDLEGDTTALGLPNSSTFYYKQGGTKKVQWKPGGLIADTPSFTNLVTFGTDSTIGSPTGGGGSWVFTAGATGSNGNIVLQPGTSGSVYFGSTGGSINAPTGGSGSWNFTPGSGSNGNVQFAMASGKLFFLGAGATYGNSSNRNDVFTGTLDASTKVVINGENVSAAPRPTTTAFLPGALTSTATGATWTLDKAITVTRVQVQAKTAPSGCTTNAVVRLSDGTTNQDVTVSAAANDSGAISKNYSAAAALTVAVQTAAAGCGTSPADANVIVQYRMQ